MLVGGESTIVGNSFLCNAFLVSITLYSGEHVPIDMNLTCCVHVRAPSSQASTSSIDASTGPNEFSQFNDSGTLSTFSIGCH